MAEKDFVAYVGNPDFHDGPVRSVSYTGETAQVHLEGYSGREFTVSFTGVRKIVASRPLGMMIYALSEMSGTPPYRWFIFANSDDEDEASLEIEAREFKFD